MNPPDPEIRLEGFAETLRGHRLYCVGSPAQLPGLVKSRLAILDTETAHRGRRVLILQDGGSAGQALWLFRMKWDAVFHVHDATDLRLALTYVANAAKPIRLVWAGPEPANSVFAALGRLEGLTLIGFGVAQPAAADWDMIFWTHDTPMEQIESTLQPRYGHVPTLRSMLREIAAADVGMVWSVVGEPNRRGNLLWFDPAEGVEKGAPLYTSVEAADLLRSVADSLAAGTATR
jgi:hypothetical protein